jgi:hypothetical protein
MISPEDFMACWSSPLIFFNQAFYPDRIRVRIFGWFPYFLFDAMKIFILVISK